MGRERFGFWRTWMLIALGCQVVMGFSVFFIDSILWDWHQDRTARALWGSTQYLEQTQRYRGWVMSLFGPTLSAWALALGWVVQGPFARRERWAWWCVTTSLLLWFVPDTAYSATHGVWINVAFNLSALFVNGLPLAATYWAFTAHPKSDRAG